MKSILLILVIFVSFSFSVDFPQSPMADFACNACMAGRASLVEAIIPKGYTCDDLDIAQKALGKSGCVPQTLGDGESGYDSTNATQVRQKLDECNSALASAQKQAYMAFGLAGGAALFGVGVAAISVILARNKINAYTTVKKVKSKTSDSTTSRKSQNTGKKSPNFV